MKKEVMFDSNNKAVFVNSKTHKSILKQLKRGAEVFCNAEQTEFAANLKEGYVRLFRTAKEARDHGFGDNLVSKVDITKLDNTKIVLWLAHAKPQNFNLH